VVGDEGDLPEALEGAEDPPFSWSFIRRVLTGTPLKVWWTISASTPFKDRESFSPMTTSFGLYNTVVLSQSTFLLDPRPKMG